MKNKKGLKSLILWLSNAFSSLRSSRRERWRTFWYSPRNAVKNACCCGLKNSMRAGQPLHPSFTHSPTTFLYLLIENLWEIQKIMEIAKKFILFNLTCNSFSDAEPIFFRKIELKISYLVRGLHDVFSFLEFFICRDEMREEGGK